MQALDIFLFFFLVCSLFWIGFLVFLILTLGNFLPPKSNFDFIIQFIAKFSIIFAVTSPLWAVCLPYMIAAYAPNWLKIAAFLVVGIALLPTLPAAVYFGGNIRDNQIRKKP